MRLLEGIDLTHIHPKLLSLEEFATGVQYHHNKPFMKQIRENKMRPYNFHMCWTANKGDKIKFFKEVGMCIYVFVYMIFILIYYYLHIITNTTTTIRYVVCSS